MDVAEGRKAVTNTASQGTSHRIAVISDTHGLLRDEVCAILSNCEVILHAGDIGKRETYEELERIADVYAVRGNTDRGWTAQLPMEQDLSLFGLKIYMVHDKKQMRKNLEGYDVAIYGHSHKYDERTDGSTLFLNPGSCGPKRFRLPVTMAVLEVAEKASDDERSLSLQDQSPLNDRDMHVHRVDLSVSQNSDAYEKKINDRDMRMLIASVVREMNNGQSITKMAAKHKIPATLVEQICRIYVTHPGVDAEGILNKMEVSALFEKDK